MLVGHGAPPRLVGRGGPPALATASLPVRSVANRATYGGVPTWCCFATGQAAGTAAALAVSGGLSPRELDVGRIQSDLLGQGLKLGLAGEVTAEVAGDRS
ncbi:MAG: FAD-dependent oxidoreductase [Thermoleophilia bacterium]